MADNKSALAVFAHPDDIEFVAAGTLLLLKEKGWDIHYFNLSGGDLGSLEHKREETRAIRTQEGRDAAKILGATFHDPGSNDLQILYDLETIKKIGAVIRKANPSIILTHALSDYMYDHENTARLVVSAAFVKGMTNYETLPLQPAVSTDVTIYHAMPHGLQTPMRQRVRAGQYVDTSTVHSKKREALAAHKSQKDFLDITQGMDSYLATMDELSKEVGTLSGQFAFAEGWRRHLHLGFSGVEQDPLAEVLGDLCLIDDIYEASLRNPT
ncbi:MAG: PIG-L family deacetylase [Verrucomicrobia bacterium]|nr:PIG-L family deacetylase [Verrucomicrobiota bacterium]MDA1068767.1 PIG-L family deacetylase [Verrucomicrobiota bacterium]